MDNEYGVYIRQISFCANLPDEVIRALGGVAFFVERPAGTVIQLEGEPVEGLWFVANGRVKISRLAQTGREQVLHILTEGQHFNIVALFDERGCPANAEALTDVKLMALPREGMVRLIERYPALALALLRELTGRLRGAINMVDSLALHTVQGRLAALLLARAEADRRGETLPPLTQAEMAARLGTVREMVARTLKTFENQGLIEVSRGEVTVLDFEGLERRTES